MTRCQENMSIQANAIQIIWGWRQKMAGKLASGEPITLADIEQIDPPTEAMAEALRRCR